ncbi:MAG: hypothetical protein U0269_28805 [Polyangiales bacterium]
MFNVARPPTPTDFDESAMLTELAERRRDGKEGSKLFLPNWRAFKRQLGAGDVHAKCAYCEAVRRVTYELDVEHVRPKSGVRRWKPADEPTLVYPRRVVDRDTGQLVDEKPEEDSTTTLPGYWWLAYRWSNYLLACKECNSGWKREFFPIVDEARRWSDASSEADDEGALLLDPAAFDFDSTKHFHWSTDGTVQPLSDRATATIITCGLNRFDLVQERQAKQREIDGFLHMLFDAIGKLDRALAENTMLVLDALTAATAPFTAMARFVVVEFYRTHDLHIRRPWERRKA